MSDLQIESRLAGPKNQSFCNEFFDLLIGSFFHRKRNSRR